MRSSVTVAVVEDQVVELRSWSLYAESLKCNIEDAEK